ncbi:hypothetical protein [Flavobacterium sp. H122]|uniref:hypothetical protein n=1 Tax=Flavobacterium sp. H122 TaxID=2529860 RepID=UPI0010AA374B|nr:hypothetical protein [Flavobacterium sp. H122]
MKFFAKIVLAFFMLFQFSSVIICVINEKNNSAIAFNITEEEEHQKVTKQLKSEVVFGKNIYDEFIVENSQKNNFDFYLLKDYSSALNPFFSPPEQV